MSNVGSGYGDFIVASLWLINRTLKSGATKALFGQGLAGLGMGAAAQLFGGLGRKPLDPEDT
jgi:hypothetical protein